MYVCMPADIFPLFQEDKICMYACMDVCIHIYIRHTYIQYTYIHHIHVVHVSYYTYIYIHTYIHTYIHYTHVILECFVTHACIYRHAHTYIHKCLHTYIHTYIHTVEEVHDFGRQATQVHVCVSLRVCV